MQKAFGVLSELQNLIETKANTNKFIDASNRFYTFIPHSFGIDDPPLLNTPEVIKVRSTHTRSQDRCQIKLKCN